MSQTEGKSIDRPRVALIGRPNVGKSTLFNVLTRSRKALVKDEPGVTRDIQIEAANWWGKDFEIVDTGGITEGREGFSPLIREKTLGVLQSCDLIIAIMDGKVGLVPEDRDIVRIAKESAKPMLLVVNKVDQTQNEDLAAGEFYEFGLEVLSCSFEHHHQVDVLVEWIIQGLPKSQPKLSEDGIRLAIIGKPNAGKSSLCNRLLGEGRMLVSDTAGTTVDAIETTLVYDSKNYTIVDTAGLRGASKRKDGVEQVSAFKSQDAINKSHIVLLVIDALTGVSDQDAKLLQFSLEAGKPVILVVNKMDLALKEIPGFRKDFQDKLSREFHFYTEIHVVYVSAKTGMGIKNLFSKVDEMQRGLEFQVSTSKLNQFFFDVIRQAPAPVYGTRNVKFYYLTQTSQRPPSFIAFANHPEGVTPAYRRFVIKRMKENWNLWGIPLQLYVMKSQGRSSSRGH